MSIIDLNTQLLQVTMFALRSVEKKDLKDLFELSKLMNFINLPSNIDLLEKKIKSSSECFHSPSAQFWKNYYIFVLEDLKENKVIGASMIHAQHGTPEEPHFFLKLGKEEKKSETLKKSFSHKTLKLGYETNGYSEIGGLVLNPSYRGNKEKLGKQLSFVRFLFMGLNPERFTKTIHSELMPPFDKSGSSPLWKAIGEKFFDMDYQKADTLSLSNKEFILSLYPSETIYENLLPEEAREVIGQVGPHTKPVKKMLESIGFKFTNEVDPFDGGPHYRTPLKEIKPIKEMIKGTIQTAQDFNEKTSSNYLITLPTEKGQFYSVKIKANVNNISKENAIMTIEPTLCEYFKIEEGQYFSAISL